MMNSGTEVIKTYFFAVLGSRPAVIDVIRAGAFLVPSLFCRFIGLDELAEGRISTEL